MGWMTRKALAIANITLNIKHTKDEAGVEKIDIDQTLTGGIKGTSEHRTLDYVYVHSPSSSSSSSLPTTCIGYY